MSRTLLTQFKSSSKEYRIAPQVYRRNGSIVRVIQSDELKTEFAGQDDDETMPEFPEDTILSVDSWNGNDEEVVRELKAFILEFGSFTPEWFVDIKFHLLRQSGLSMESRDELCTLSIDNAFCPKCDFLYTAKKCLLWLNLFRIIRPALMKRAPPCIKFAYSRNSIKTVADFVVKAKLVDAPFYKVRSAPSCKSLRRWDYCDPDEYCRAMKRENTIEYAPARERVRRSRPL